MDITGKEILWRGSYIQSVRISYKDRLGVERQWEAIERIGCDGVVIVVPFTKDGKVVLIRQYRPAVNKSVVELPAGLIENGEEVIAACRRELIEETGYVPDSISVLTEGIMSTGINSEHWTALVAEGCEPAPASLTDTHKPDEAEDIEVMLVEMDKVYDLLDEIHDRGDLVDIRIYGLIELAMRKLKR